MRRRLPIRCCVLLATALLLGGCSAESHAPPSRSDAAWHHYRRAFVASGRVLRPTHGRDTVSEGQAYAMLRAVWMDDRQTFNRCYRWTEEHLSRREKHGDALLAWHYGRDEDGELRVLDWTPASDADLDYALALLFASKTWPRGAPKNLPSYRERALAGLDDILRKMVLELPQGEMVLLPWPLDQDAETAFPVTVNPSYFSPAHYRIFYRETGEERWRRLLDDTYAQAGRVLEGVGERRGFGLPPDWCLIDAEGNFLPSEERGTASSWDAFRLWWRVGLDLRLADEQRARALIEKHLIPFLQHELEMRGRVYMEYEYGGRPIKHFSSPASLGVYAWCVSALDPTLSARLKAKMQDYVKAEGDMIYYGKRNDYYVNSWAWFGDAISRAYFPPAMRKGR